MAVDDVAEHRLRTEPKEILVLPKIHPLGLDPTESQPMPGREPPSSSPSQHQPDPDIRGPRPVIGQSVEQQALEFPILVVREATARIPGVGLGNRR